MAIYYNKIYCNSQDMCYNIYIMKKTLTILIIVMLFATAAISMTGCNDSFGAKNVREQIESNLGWHRGGTEVCEYEVLDGETAVGTYKSSMTYAYSENVIISPSIEAHSRTLENFSGYKFISELNAEKDGKTYKRYTESYSDLGLAPILSYVKEEGEETIETISSYEKKRVNAVYIKGGEATESSIKYSAGSLTYDNAFIYQFARATDIATALGVTVPTFSNSKVNKSTYTVTYMAGATVTMDKNFVLKKEYVSTEGESESGSTKGAYDSEDQITVETAEDGKVTTKYPYTDTSLIPASKCTFTSNNSSLVRGQISCYISAYPIRNSDGGRFAARAVVMMQEGSIVYRLKSITYSA